MRPRLGYPCLNLVLDAGTNSTLRLANVPDADKVRAVVARNMEALERILRFNAEHGVRLFRVGSAFVPFASHERFPYDWAAEHAPRLAELGRLARDTGQRLSIHPGQYTVPGSPDPGIVGRSIAELRYAAKLIDLFGTDEGVVVIHIGGAYGDKPASVRRFVDVLSREPAILRSLALENDERIWAPHEVIRIARELGVGAIVDSLHHRLNPGALTLSEAIGLASETWRTRRIGGPARQKLHISSQDPEKIAGAHARGIDAADWDELLAAVGGRDVDIMIESKGKEQSLRGLGLGTIPATDPAAEGPDS